MKNTHFFIAPQEHASLKKWWFLAGILSIITILVTTACTIRMYRLISAKEKSIPLAQQSPLAPKVQIPQVTIILEQITQNLPGSVAFNSIHLESTNLIIQGKTLDQHAWASWTESLSNLAWVTQVQVEYLQKMPKKAEYTFSVRLCF